MNEVLVFKNGTIKKMMPATNEDAAGASAASNEQTKKCPSCGRVLPASAFFKHGRSADGLTCECIECIRRKRDAKKSPNSNPLAQFTARELMHELSMRGYKGELTYTEVKVHKMKIGEA